MAKKTDRVPSRLVTHHVFLDTDVYRQLGHNSDNPVLGTLSDCIEDSGIVLHIADITFEEIRRQLHEYVAEATVAMAAARKHFGRWKKRHPEIVKADIPEFDAAAVADAAFTKLRRRIKYDWNAQVHEAMAVPASEVFGGYFGRRPPFGARNSKEFPDAFVLTALERWCRDNGERMYVVSRPFSMGTRPLTLR
ncbi:PIN domain-containing protein [Magnetospirillum sp. 15-1]|uniref:PIN domain-containing protein n=1 Tax=Magnetospirillum sp. 15-1 TaxID=1979370 RepID=UPI001483BFDD|nr:PIN domain-containing protein [Magnetospirillum sp. 15-1]